MYIPSYANAMTSTATAFSYPGTRLSIPRFHLQIWQCHPRIPTIFSRSFSHPRRRRRPTRRNPNRTDPSHPSSSSNSSRLQFVLHVDQLKTAAPISFLQRTLTSLESKFDDFISSGTEAYRDLQTLITIEPRSNKVLVSCSESTVRFVAGAALWSCVAVVMIRVLVGLGLGFRNGNGGGRVEVVRRRDRSLGGREVVVARKVVEGRSEESDIGSLDRNLRVLRKDLRKREERKLPSWWPVILPRTVVEANREEFQRVANRLIQEIMDAKLSGKDVSEDDILQLRRICRMSGVRLSIGTENARDSLYRLSVQNVINACCMAGSPSVEIGGEEARQFLAGLAYDLGLTAARAATIVCAAVAARTRLWFLQAWALEMQSKQSEAMDELKKICFTHQMFPPEPSSPEIELVARGLEKQLKVEDRQFLLSKLINICGEESRRSAAEALGLI